ncbi:Pca regulon regulatory protein [Pseudooceanicola marinus]|uniref:Pca regulon regulatory protein n=1 Tax=Pseudooceanicola marinus TaxID=396013 RepID=A0A1X6Y682_9RHOB|nr:IclR family transcriptional regulator [Pseudooceanicola marinus]PJE33291.1 IclR family transcriptional regulator [Pseudooceanicola marinus]SLN11871.1 Pca regulon regulatory protein [Pseudooceanicola marinus]
MAKEPDYRSNSLLRGLSILECFDHRHAEMTLTEIAEAISVTSSAAYRFVVTLEREGYLTRRENCYRLAPRVMDLGYRYLASLDVYDVARLPADALRNATGFTVHVAVLDGNEIVYVYRALSDRAMVSNVPVGSRLPAFSTTMGRVLLSDLPEAELNRRFEGYAFDRMSDAAPDSLAELKQMLKADRARGYVAQSSHLATGTVSIAAPLISRHGAYVAAINLSGHEMQLTPTDARVAQVLDTAREISALL